MDSSHGFLCLILPRETDSGSEGMFKIFLSLFRVACTVICHTQMEINDGVSRIPVLRLTQPFDCLIHFAFLIIDPSKGIEYCGVIGTERICLFHKDQCPAKVFVPVA